MLVDFVFPMNAQMMFEIVMRLVSFEIIPEFVATYFFESLTGEDLDSPSSRIVAFSPRFGETGYDNGYITYLMFTPLVLTFLSSLGYLMTYCKKVYYRKHKKATLENRVTYKQLSKKLRGVDEFYLRLMIELSLDIFVIGMIQIYMRQLGTLW